MTDERPPARRGVPTWVFGVVALVLSAALVGGISIAVRSGGDGDDGPDLTGPAATLPAVTDAATQLLGAAPAEDDVAAALGTAYGDVTIGLSTISDPVEFAERFTRLPDAQAKLAGRTLGAVQAQLTPESAGGTRVADQRDADIRFALAMAHAMIQTAEPDVDADHQARDMLPFSVQELEDFDRIAADFAAGDLDAVAAAIDPALSEAGAAEIISSIAYVMTYHVPSDDELLTLFDEAYQAALPR